MQNLACQAVNGNAVLPAEPQNILSWAKRYAANGYPIFPVGPDKTPYVRWKEISAPSVGQVEEWWGKWPNAMIGMATGSRSGLVVVDVDVKNGKDGFATMRANGWTLPAGIVEVKTPTGGSHYYFPFDGETRNSASEIGIGIDIRGEGGYVVLPSCPALGGLEYRFTTANSGQIAASQPLPSWAKASDHVAETGKRIRPGEGRRAPNYAVALNALRSRDPSDPDRNEWLLFSGAFFNAIQGLPGAENAKADWLAWNEPFENNDPAANSRAWHDFERSGANGDFHTLASMDCDPNKTALAYALFGNSPAPMPRGASPQTKSLFVRVGEMRHRPAEYLVDKLVETDSLGLVFGSPASGKSFIAIDMASCVATGTSFHGHNVRKGAVFYIAGEGRNGLKRRFTAWEEQRVVSLETADLFTSDGVAVRFLDTESAGRVEREIHQLAIACGPPQLIVVDTLARNFGPGNENSQEDMGKFVAALDRLKSAYPGCVILVVHHSGHSDGERARGSSALRAALDVEFKADKKGDEITFTNTKMKDGPEPRPLKFNLETVGDSAALTFVGEELPGRDHKLSKWQQEALDVFKAIGKDVVPLDEWRDRFYEKHTGTNDAKRKAFNDVRTQLINKSIIVEVDDQNYKLSSLPGTTPFGAEKTEISGESPISPPLSVPSIPGDTGETL